MVGPTSSTPYTMVAAMAASYAASQGPISPRMTNVYVPILLTEGEQVRYDAGERFQIAVFQSESTTPVDVTEGTNWQHITGRYYQALIADIGVSETYRVRAFDNIELVPSQFDVAQWQRVLNIVTDTVSELPIPLSVGNTYRLTAPDTITPRW